MTLQLDQRACEAVIHGPPRKLMDGAAPTVMENIACRVAEAPDGLIRTFQVDGTLREQTFAELWGRCGDIAALLRSLDVGPGSQTVLLLGDLLDFLSCFWASLRVGATPIPFTGVARASTVEELKNLVARLERPALIADAPTPEVSSPQPTKPARNIKPRTCQIQSRGLNRSSPPGGQLNISWPLYSPSVRFYSPARIEF